MSNYFSSVIIFTFLFSISMIAVSGQESAETTTLDDEMAVEGKEAVGENGETNIRETKQDERIEALDKRIGDLHNNISSFLTVIGILGGIITFVFSALAVLITVKYTIDVNALRRSVYDEVKIIKETRVDSMRALREAERSAGKAREYAETAEEELAKIQELKQKEVTAAAEELPPTSEIDEKRDLVEEVLKKYPSLRQSTDFMYEAAMRGDVKDKRTLVNIAKSLNANGEYGKVVELTDFIQEERDIIPSLIFEKAFALGELGRNVDAVEIYNEYITVDPSSAIAYNNKGIDLSILERYNEAIKAYDKAIELKPGYPSAYYNRACAYSLWGKKNKMLSDLRKAIDLVEKYREDAKIEEDFDSYRDDPDFRRLVYAEDFNEGEESG